MILLRTLPYFFIALLLIGCQTQSEPAPPLEELTIAEAHAAFQAGTLNSQDLVRAYLERIDQYDGALNSLTYLNPAALEDAKALDEEYAKTKQLRPLHGIPLIVKDNINTAGMPTTAGALALQDFRPEKDAFIIERLREAGAVILAKSNMAEWAFSPMHTESSTAGTTHNPYDTTRVPAGSSGGTGASVAANLGLVGLGTDTGNSIRGPSSHNSLVGFRTTIGLISRSAIVPLYMRNDVVGPMCRTVEDATRVMEVMVGIDLQDPYTIYSQGEAKETYLPYLQVEGLRGKRIGALADLTQTIDPEIEGLFEQALADLERLGATVLKEVRVPGFDTLRQNQWCSEFRLDLEGYLATYVTDDSLRTLEDVQAIGSHSQYAEDGVAYFLTASGRSGFPDEVCGNPYHDPRRVAFREAIEAVMDSLQVDVLVYPSWNFPPARIAQFQEEYRGDNSQVISPHTGQPAFTVPMGFTEAGLPAGLQVLGRMYAEPTLIEVCYGYEQGTLHRRPPVLD